MVRTSSEKSSKSTKPKKKPAPPAEHQPVKQVAEIPIALVEIKSLAAECRTDWDMEAAKGRSEIKARLGQVVILAESCAQAIKLEGLARLIKSCGITQEEKGVIEDALYHYHSHCWSALPISKQEAVKTMIALFEALQVVAPEPEVVATVNPIPELEGVAPEYPGISERIDREIELVNQMMEKGVESGEFKVKILAPSKDQCIETQPPGGVRTCRVCRCTDDDCRQCFEKTGRPCHWVEPDLCSACVQTEGKTGYQSSGVIAEG